MWDVSAGRIGLRRPRCRRTGPVEVSRGAPDRRSACGTFAHAERRTFEWCVRQHPHPSITDELSTSGDGLPAARSPSPGGTHQPWRAIVVRISDGAARLRGQAAGARASRILAGGDSLAASPQPAGFGWLLGAALVVWNGWALVTFAQPRTALLPGGATSIVIDRRPFAWSRNPLYRPAPRVGGRGSRGRARCRRDGATPGVDAASGGARSCPRSATRPRSSGRRTSTTPAESRWL